MKKIDGAVEYGMVLGGITDHTHTQIYCTTKWTGNINVIKI